MRIDGIRPRKNVLFAVTSSFFHGSVGRICFLFFLFLFFFFFLRGAGGKGVRGPFENASEQFLFQS